MRFGSILPVWKLVGICLFMLSYTGCSSRPLYCVCSPSRSCEARVFGSQAPYQIFIDRIALFRDGVSTQEIRLPQGIVNPSVLAVADDGSLYVGSHLGHIMILRKVYVYRDGRTEYIGDAPDAGFGLKEGKWEGADFWQEWERRVKGRSTSPTHGTE